MKNNIIFFFLIILVFNVTAQESFKGETWKLIKKNKTDSDCPFYEIKFETEDTYCISVNYDSVRCGVYNIKGRYLNIPSVLKDCENYKSINHKSYYRFKKMENDTVVIIFHNSLIRKKRVYKIER